MSFFKQFPKVEYDFNRMGIKQNMIDLFRSVRPLPSFLDNYSAYKFYEIKNGERPDIVSQRLYGTSAYYWTFFVINDFLHDGYRAWPMSQEDLDSYITKEYEGFVIETHPEIVRTGDNIITEFKNSIAGRVTLGEEIRGATSGATGTLTKKHIDMNQLIIQNVTGTFVGDPDANPNVTELIVGQTSEDSVSTYQVWKFADAPYYYYDENAGTGAVQKIILTNGGSNYTSVPTVTFQGDGNISPTATATISGGKVTAITINSKGSGHSTLNVTITGGGGSGATARAVLYPDEKRPVSSASHFSEASTGGVARSDLAYETYRDHEFHLNEERSKIRYVDPNYINDFVNKFESTLNA